MSNKLIFGRVQNIVMKSNIPYQAKAVYAILTIYAGPKDECWPSMESLAADLKVEIQFVRKYIRLLSESGVLKIEKRFKNGRTGLKYVFNRKFKDESTFAGAKVSPDKGIPGETFAGTSNQPLPRKPLYKEIRKEKNNITPPAEPKALLDKYPKEYPQEKTDKFLWRIIQECIKVGGFTTTLPKEGKGPSKTIREIAQKIFELKTGRFLDRINDNFYHRAGFKDIPPETGYDTWKEVKDKLITSCKNIALGRQEGYPGHNRRNQGMYPLEFSKFLYNPISKKSQFVRFLNEVPKSNNTQMPEFQKNKCPKGVQAVMTKLLKDSRANFTSDELLQFWSTTNRLCSWYQKNDRQLNEYNRIYGENTWGSYCGTIEDFFKIVVKYLDTQGKLFKYYLSTDKDKPSWQKFRRFCDNNYQFEIEPDPKKLKDIPNEKKRRAAQEKEDEIIQRMRKIEQTYKHEGVPIPSTDVLRKKALTQLKQEQEDDE